MLGHLEPSSPDPSTKSGYMAFRFPSIIRDDSGDVYDGMVRDVQSPCMTWLQVIMLCVIAMVHTHRWYMEPSDGCNSVRVRSELGPRWEYDLATQAHCGCARADVARAGVSAYSARVSHTSVLGGYQRLEQISVGVGLTVFGQRWWDTETWTLRACYWCVEE